MIAYTLLIEGLEEELHTTEEVVIFFTGTTDVFGLAITESTNNILEERVVAADFPAFFTRFYNISGISNHSVLAEMAIGNPCTPGALIFFLSTLVV